MTSEGYIKAAISTVELDLNKTGSSLPKKCLTPFKTGYHPSQDTSPELDEEGTKKFQELVVTLRWAIELGRVDILLEVSLLSTHLFLPCDGHLQQLLHIYGYLKESPRRRIYFDPAYPNVSEDRFHSFEWEDF